MNIIRMTFLLISCFLSRGLLAKEKFNECINNVCIGDTLAKVESRGYVNTQSDGEEFYRRKSSFKKDGFEVIHRVNVNGHQKTVCSHSMLIMSKNWEPKGVSDVITAFTGVKVKVPTDRPREHKDIIKEFSDGFRALFIFRNDFEVDILGPNHCPKVKLEGFPASIIRSSTKSKR
jgi:hypothetical protein